MTEKKTAIEKVRESLQEVKLDLEMNTKSNCQECVYCTTTAISNGDAYYCQKNKCFIGDMDNVCEFFEYQEKSLKYMEVGKLKEATQRYYSETRVHKVKLKEINEDRKKSLTEYEKTIQEYLKQHNQNFIEDVSVLDDKVLIELERDVGISWDSMMVLEGISDEWSIIPGENLKIWLKIWDNEEDNDD